MKVKNTKFFVILLIYFIESIFFESKQTGLPSVAVAKAGVISDAPTLAQGGLNIFNFLLSIAGVIVIISLVVSGIMYFLAGGDEKRISQAKKATLNSIIGAVIILGAKIIIITIGNFIK